MTPLALFGMFIACSLYQGSDGLDNGLALTPPMGWMTWERYRCTIDCSAFPDSCISEKLIKEQAKAMVDGGYLKAGYEYIVIDDCWLDHSRDPETGEIRPDSQRFPSGIKALAKYVHDLGLKFGIYEDYGNYTCAGYPGVLQNMEKDAKTLANWDIDYLKLDGCYADPADMDEGYPLFGKYLNETGRPIVYSCSWPAYQGAGADFESIAEHCNLWRNYADIQDSWSSVVSIIDWFGDNQDKFAHFAGPGHWNDPDMLLLGNFGLSYDQARVQMALWAVLSAPLLMSADLTKVKDDFKDLLLNEHVIKINQDPLGHHGLRKLRHQNVDIFVKPIMPVVGDVKSAAVAVLNKNDQGTPSRVSFSPRQLGLNFGNGYLVTDAFEGSSKGVVYPDTEIVLDVNPTGVQFLKLELITTMPSTHSGSSEKFEVYSHGLTGWNSDLP